MARRSRLNTANNKRRRLWIFVVILLCIAGIVWIWFAYKKQLINIAAIWQETVSVENRETDSVRGTIYDRNFKELAQTLERVSIYVRPREVKDISQLPCQNYSVCLSRN
jgi:cell division protein FtsI (penicillin-binding protein 3)